MRLMIGQKLFLLLRAILIGGLSSFCKFDQIMHLQIHPITDSHPDLTATISGNFSDGKGFAAYRVVVSEPDKMAKRVNYQLLPVSTAGDYRFEIADGVKVISN